MYVIFHKLCFIRELMIAMFQTHYNYCLHHASLLLCSLLVQNKFFPWINRQQFLLLHLQSARFEFLWFNKIRNTKTELNVIAYPLFYQWLLQSRLCGISERKIRKMHFTFPKRIYYICVGRFVCWFARTFIGSLYLIKPLCLHKFFE